jgi:DNA repair exonuclease SbcCD ATPase subunit
MDKEIKDLLENDVLGEDAKTALQEAFDNKVKAAVAAAEQKLQEDYAARYSNDKAVLVEAMDKMLGDAIRSELTEFAEDRSALIKQRAKLSKQTMEAKKWYAQKLKEHTKLLNTYVDRQLRGEIAEFVDDRKTLDEQRQEMAKELESARLNSKKAFTERVNKLETFVLKQLSEEIAEFQADKKALVEQRVKLAQEGKKKLHEAQTKFIERAGQAVNKTLDSVIRKELVQWREDIKVARENNFGRRIFEAVAAEYMASYLSEGSEVKKLSNLLSKQKAALEEAQKQINEKETLVETARAEARAANDRIKRTETMNELLKPLSRDKKTVMEDLLKDIKTTNLKEAFSRYLPAVMNGGKVEPAKQTLAETTQPKSVAITGDRQNKLSQAVIEESKQSDDLGVILHLAGIKN